MNTRRMLCRVAPSAGVAEGPPADDEAEALVRQVTEEILKALTK